MRVCTAKLSAAATAMLLAALIPAVAAGETPATAPHGQSPAAAAAGASPMSPGSPVTGSRAPLSRPQFCGAVFNNYRKVLLSNPEVLNTKNPSWNGLIGVSATIARHETLERLLSMANSRSCDLDEFLGLEERVILGTYLTPEVR